MKVTLLAHTPEPEKIIASAAKLCYSAATIDDVMAKVTDEEASRFVNMLASYGHESPIEHVTFTFGIEGVSRALLAQITRHRIGSFSVQSQRYVREGLFEYVTPPEIEKIPKAKELFVKAMEDAQKSYDDIATILKEEHIKNLVAEGMDEQSASRVAEKKAIEDARFVLPNSCDTKMIMTMNARSLMNFFHHRCCNRAQWEIRELAYQMTELVKEVAPSLFKYAGPSCIHGACPEGSMTCGKMKEMKKLYLGD